MKIKITNERQDGHQCLQMRCPEKDTATLSQYLKMSMSKKKKENVNVIKDKG